MDNLIQEQYGRLLKTIEDEREKAFYAGFKHGMAVQTEIFEEEYADYYTHTGNSNERRKLVEALEAFARERGTWPSE